ncbi:hypothetical protein TWF788_004467 [Orbilia oligospora]|uniref:Uncharacterized protein n=1 Tax=Orbilia oligospora TaxID=2813651 RepID=A0A7C8P2V5_ORBOL|nr:hypothetical protein TWF788_004467 [Orbilia oligospora]KAF3214821.1 hypothetical protein TWF679_004600 [Orbilia oligospora]
MSSPSAYLAQQHPESDPTNRPLPYFRRVTSSQRSHSPPPQDRKPICSVIKNVLCFPICGKKKPNSGEEKEDDKAEAERLEAKLLELDSIISSEEQTKAPEGDKLPIFTRLRDWTAHQREEEEEEEEADKRTRKKEGKDEKGGGLPLRSVSVPVPVPVDTPISDLPKERRRRRRSEGNLPKPTRDSWGSRTERKKESPVFQDTHISVRKPDPPLPQTRPTIPINFSRLNIPIRETPGKSPAYSDPRTGNQGNAKTSRKIRPIVPPKIPTHAGNYGYDAVPVREHNRKQDSFFSVDFRTLEKALPMALRPWFHDNDSDPPRKHANPRKKAKQDEPSHHHRRRHHTREHGKHGHHHHSSQRVLKDEMRRRKDPTAGSLHVEVESGAGRTHGHKHCKRHRHRQRCRRHRLKEEGEGEAEREVILHASVMPRVVWGGYYEEPMVWQRYDFM